LTERFPEGRGADRGPKNTNSIVGNRHLRWEERSFQARGVQVWGIGTALVVTKFALKDFGV
jgi:hypothetical protein